MNDWTGKRILVLGASGGIGSCCVRQLYDKGATVLAADLSPNEKIAAVPFSHCDVSDANSVDDLFSLANRHWADWTDLYMPAESGHLPACLPHR